MTTEVTSLEFVTLTERVYKYIRQYAIKSPNDAAVELLTNSVDAYNKGNITEKKIYIEYHDSGKLIVIDNAIGLTSTELQSSFLQVGEYTNVEGARGFFSRGAKDISALGDVTFESIKDGFYSKCFLNSDAYGAIQIADVAVTAEQRTQLKIPVNGLCVTLELLDSHKLTDINTFSKELETLAVLRDIMSNTNNEIIFNHYLLNESLFLTKQLSYIYPNGTELLNLTFTVPNYPDATAEFIVYKLDEPQPEPLHENMLEFGFLIKDSATVYEVNTIDDRFRWNPQMNLIRGYLKCDYISTLLHDYDEGTPTDANPSPIIDPSRTSGLNNEHPFTSSLYAIPKTRIDQILRDINQGLSRSSITITEVDQLLDELSKLGLNIIENEDINVEFTPSYDEKLIKAIEDDRGNYVQTEKNYLMTTDYNVVLLETDNYVREELVRLNVTPSDQFVYTDQNELVQLINKTETEEINEPIDILDLINNQSTSISREITNHPYVYGLAEGGELTKVYIFDKGSLDNTVSTTNEQIQLNNKKFNITFIDDINLTERYVINYDDGINIKLNLHNDSIKNYLSSETATKNIRSSLTADLAIDNISQTQSLLFMQELMIDAISQILVDNDVSSGKLALESNAYNNVRKVSIHKNKLASKIENSVTGIFSGYINKNISTKISTLNALMDMISYKVGTVVDLNIETDIVVLKNELDLKITELVE